METEERIDRYRRYLESIDAESERVADEDEYFDLLAPGEAIDLLCTRDELEECLLSYRHRREVARLDALLRKHSRLISGNIRPFPEKPADRWWWHLGEEQAVRRRASVAGPIRTHEGQRQPRPWQPAA